MFNVNGFKPGDEVKVSITLKITRIDVKEDDVIVWGRDQNGLSYCAPLSACEKVSE